MSSTHRHLLLDFFWQVISGPPCIFKKQSFFFTFFNIRKVFVNLEILILIIQSKRPFCASPSCLPRLALGLQSLGLAQKDSLLLLMIYS
jgi:hypothetical protein